MSSPSLLTFTVMKNEGPFVLEWVAYQQLMGVDRIVVMTNDCDDGTDRILDRLEDLGHVRHLPNPCTLSPHLKKPHGVGIAYARQLREWREADYIFLSDVDEFPLVNTGAGTLKDLLAYTDYPDAISMNEMLFGTGGVVDFEDKLVTESFTWQCARWPSEKDGARRGLKSIHRNLPQTFKTRNHRPLVAEKRADQVRWLDGSGNDFPHDIRHLHIRGCDCRGRTDLAVVNHYTLRSLDSFLVKIDRGDAMVEGRIGRRYFEKRNMNHEQNTDMLRMVPRLQDEVANLMKDSQLAELHASAVDAHKHKIAAMKAKPAFARLLRKLGHDPKTKVSQAA